MVETRRQVFILVVYGRISFSIIEAVVRTCVGNASNIRRQWCRLGAAMYDHGCRDNSGYDGVS
jgi:hypothetical protein